jgi:hypothetical protein
LQEFVALLFDSELKFLRVVINIFDLPEKGLDFRGCLIEFLYEIVNVGHDTRNIIIQNKGINKK